MTGDIDPCRHPCTTLVLPLVLGVRQVTVAAIQKRLQSFFASSAFLCPHSRPVLHSTRPVSFTPHALQPFMLHTTRPGSRFASHHASCKPTLLHTTPPPSFTPHILEADFAYHHCPASRFCFTQLVLRAYMLDTTRPESFTPRFLKADLVHTTRPASFTPHVLRADFASHHLSCKLA